MMTSQLNQKNINKRGAIPALFAGSILITVLGVAYGAYSWINNVSLNVFGMDVPGMVFAGFAVYLGVRYFIHVLKIRKTIDELRQ